MECKICQNIKTLDNFYFRKDTNNYRTECKDCIIIIKKLLNRLLLKNY